MLTRERFRSMLDPYIFQVYEQTIEKGDDVIPDLYGVHTTDLAEERVTGIGATGLMQPWAGQVHYDDVSPLWDRTYRILKYSIGLKMEKDLWDDGQHAEIRDRVQRVSLSVHRTRQLHAHDPFVDAFAGAALRGPDGLPLCAANHPNAPGSIATQSNLGTAPLSVDSLEAARIAMMTWTDDRGKRLLRVPDLLVVPPALEVIAKTILLSTDRPDTADRATNVRKGAYKVVVLPLLTDTNNWFLIDSQQAKLFMKWFERRRPVPERDEDFDTETLKWKYVARYAYGFHHWSFVFGNSVA